jgi:hypothetical protein
MNIVNNRLHYITYNKLGKIITLEHNDINHAPLNSCRIYDLPEDFHSFIDNNYVLNGVITPRLNHTIYKDKSTIIANEIDIITLSNIIPNSTIEIKNISIMQDIRKNNTNLGISGIVVGTEETFSTSIPGIYKITISSWPYLDCILTIEAV